MNEWEKAAAKDAHCFDSEKWVVKYETLENNYFSSVPPSRWKRLKSTVSSVTRCAYMPFVNLFYLTKHIVSKVLSCTKIKPCKKDERIANLVHEVNRLENQRDFLISSNEILRNTNANLTKTLSAWIEMDSEAFKEIIAENKKAAKKRPSNKKKRKG